MGTLRTKGTLRTLGTIGIMREEKTKLEKWSQCGKMAKWEK